MSLNIRLLPRYDSQSLAASMVREALAPREFVGEAGSPVMVAGGHGASNWDGWPHDTQRIAVLGMGFDGPDDQPPYEVVGWHTVGLSLQQALAEDAPRWLLETAADPLFAFSRQTPVHIDPRGFLLAVRSNPQAAVAAEGDIVIATHPAARREAVRLVTASWELRGAMEGCCGVLVEDTAMAICALAFGAPTMLVSDMQNPVDGWANSELSKALSVRLDCMQDAQDVIDARSTMSRMFAALNSLVNYYVTVL